MANITELRPAGDTVRTARAQYIHGELRDERWSIRQASMRLGMTHSVLASRMNGTTPFTGEEIEAIAHLLKRDPQSFYGEYLAAGSGDQPRTTDYKGAVSGDVAPIVSLASVRANRASATA